MIRLKQIVVTEGKYDKITLENIIDATIVTTDGFGIFKDKQKVELIRRLGKENGIIVMTDSDSAGQLIRRHIKNICDGMEIVNVYIPNICGKEKRKTALSKDGYLGVEGMSPQIIMQALRRSGVECDNKDDVRRKLTKADIYALGLSGKENSAGERAALCRFLDLPDNLSSSGFLDAVNAVFGYAEFIERVDLWRHATDKN